MKKYEFIKQIENEEQVEIKYFGVVEDDVDLAALDEKVDRFLAKYPSCDLVRLVGSLRTILSTCDERELSVKTKNAIRSKSVKYRNGSLASFKKEDVKNINGITLNTKTKYNAERGLSFDFTDKVNIDSIKGNVLSSVEKDVSSTMYYIEALRNVEPVTLNKTDCTIIEMYKRFYDELPDFSAKDIDLKIQSMIYILSEYRFVIDGGYSFTFEKNFDMPYSQKLSNDIARLYPLGVVDNDSKVKLNKNALIIIDVVRSELYKCSNYSSEIQDVLPRVNRIIYTKKHKNTNNSNHYEIANYANTSLQEVKNTSILMKKIGSRIYDSME